MHNVYSFTSVNTCTLQYRGSFVTDYKIMFSQNVIRIDQRIVKVDNLQPLNLCYLHSHTIRVSKNAIALLCKLRVLTSL